MTKSLAMEQRETASGLFSCSAVAASRTSRRDATRLVAISASLNCRYCKTQWGTQSVVERVTDLLQKKKKKEDKTKSLPHLVVGERLSKLLPDQHVISC